MNEPAEHPPAKTATKTFWTWTNFRDVSVGLVMVVVAVRIAFAKTTIDLSGFNFTDLLSLILALSAVALSAAFYFKADESARSFYNNTYHFTKEVSEILGRIEAGFGKQLEYINQSYVGLNDKIDRIPYDSTFVREQEDAKRSEIQEQEAERDNIIQDLMRRAQMNDAEKASLQKKLGDLTDELEHSKSQLALFKRADEAGVEWFGFAPNGRKWLYEIIQPYFSRNFDGSDIGVVNRFRRVLREGVIGGPMLDHMRRMGLLDDFRLTAKGIEFIRDLLKSGPSLLD